MLHIRFLLMYGRNQHNIVKHLNMKVTQFCLTLCGPVDYTVHGILQARILAWVPIASQGIFPTQGSNLGLLPCKQFLYHLSH